MAGEKTLNGKDYIVEIDTDTPITAASGQNYRPVVCEVSSTFNISTENRAVSNACGSGWGNSVAGLSSWGMSGEWQAINPQTGDPDAASVNEMVNLAATKRTFWIRRKLIDGKTGTEILREGIVRIQNYEEVAGAEDPYTFSAEFVGVLAPRTAGGLVGILADTTGDPITIDDNFIIVTT